MNLQETWISDCNNDTTQYSHSQIYIPCVSKQKFLLELKDERRFEQFQ